MNSWPDTNNAAIDRYVRQLRLDCPTSPIYYRQALHSFQQIVAEHHPCEVNRNVLEAWLRERAAHWPPSTLLHRTRIVGRFLDFLVREGLVARNPVADLRAEYCVNSSKAVWRALLDPNPDQALEGL